MTAAQRTLVSLIVLVLIAINPAPSKACNDGSPLILDLNGDGLIRTSSNLHPVSFDIDADGFPERVLWTFWEDGDGFLFLDLNRNGRVDHGGELFGDATLLPSGELAPNGFVALAVYDRLEFGGDEDGAITRGDSIWSDLKIWVDRNHDGETQPTERSPLPKWGIVGISLQWIETDAVDGNGNGHYFQGSFLRAERKPGGIDFSEHPIHDVFFLILPPRDL